MSNILLPVHTKRQQRRSRGRSRAAINQVKQFYREPSCATCKYAKWAIWFNGDFEEADVLCNYPRPGDLGSFRDRITQDIFDYWHHPYTYEAQECGCFLQSW